MEDTMGHTTPGNTGQPGPAPSGPLAQAAQLLAQERVGEAVELMRSQASPGPEAMELLNQWGRRFMAQSQFEPAVEVFQCLAGLFPQDHRPHNALAVAFQMAGFSDASLEEMRLTAKLAPEPGVHLLNLAKLHALRGEWQEAHQAMQEALPHLPQPHDQKVKELVEVIEQRLAADPVGWSPGGPVAPMGQAPASAAQEPVAAVDIGFAPPPPADAPAPAPTPAPTPAPAPSAAAPAQGGALPGVAPAGDGQAPAWMPPPMAPQSDAPTRAASPTAQPAPPAPAGQGGRLRIEISAPPAGRAPAPAAPEPQAPVTTGGADDSRRFKVLFVQEAPGPRLMGMALALTERGHQVGLAYTQAPPSQVLSWQSDDVFEELIPITDNRQLWEAAQGYDLVHCHNGPDVLSVAALGCRRPVIHDSVDLCSLRAGGDANLAFFEGLANRAAAARVYASGQQMEAAREMYGVEGPSLVHPSLVSRGHLPNESQAKLSAQEGGWHLACRDGLDRAALPGLMELAGELAKAGATLHLHPDVADAELAAALKDAEGVVLHDPLPPARLLAELTRYDAGLIPGLGDPAYLDTWLPASMFQFQAAGIPVAAADMAACRAHLREAGSGLVFANAQELASARERLAGLAPKSRAPRTHEDEMGRVEELYRQITGAETGLGLAAA